MEGPLQIVCLQSPIGSVVFLSGTFWALGQVYDMSGDVLYEQKCLTENSKWFGQFHRSCRQLRFEVAGLYFVDPTMSLTIGSFVLENVANMLMLRA